MCSRGRRHRRRRRAVGAAWRCAAAMALSSCQEAILAGEAAGQGGRRSWRVCLRCAAPLVIASTRQRVDDASSDTYASARSGVTDQSPLASRRSQSPPPPEALRTWGAFLLFFTIYGWRRTVAGCCRRCAGAPATSLPPALPFPSCHERPPILPTRCAAPQSQPHVHTRSTGIDMCAREQPAGRDLARVSGEVLPWHGRGPRGEKAYKCVLREMHHPGVTP